MNLLTSAMSEYLLSQGLEHLHRETMEWKKDVEFWIIELDFVYKLLKKESGSAPFPGEKLADLEKQLVILYCEVLNELMVATREHEHDFTTFMTNRSSDEEGFRRTHRILWEQMINTERRIKTLKRKIFAFVCEK